jgi:hypothetical protein
VLKLVRALPQLQIIVQALTPLLMLTPLPTTYYGPTHSTGYGSTYDRPSTHYLLWRHVLDGLWLYLRSPHYPLLTMAPRTRRAMALLAIALVLTIALATISLLTIALLTSDHVLFIAQALFDGPN